jgi:hypothetical protein
MAPKRIYHLCMVLIPLLLQSCMATLSIPVLQPAQISLPQNYERLAVAHRHRAAKDNIVRNVVEGILTGEGLEADKEAGIDCLSGLKDALLKTPRYNVVEPPGLDLKGTGTGIFPSPLAWEEIERICKANNADALIVLEVFDSNSGISFSSSERKVKNKEGVDSVVIDHHARLRMTVTAGWRIYDYQQRFIVDEFRGDNWLEFTGTGPSPESAVLKLLGRREALRRTGFHAGMQYGYRIAPQWIRVSREYYTRGSESLKRAGRMAKSGNWQEAAVIWERFSSSNNKKIGFRSAYNMAIACEVKGDLEGALKWARKSYQDWGNKKALRYSRILQNRIQSQERVDQQMR